MPDPFPTFERPPIVEAVVGVQFAPVQGLTSAHMGKFWTQLGSGWPKVAEVIPISDSFESFNTPSQLLPAGIALTIPFPFSFPPGPRVQITNREGDRMIQVQSTRFHYNWQKTGDEYPSYRTVRAEFDTLFTHLQAFLSEAGLGEITPNQWEVTYNDLIPKGELWNRPEEWHRVLPGLFGHGKMEKVQLEAFMGGWHYEIVPQLGRLHVHPALGKINTTGEEGLILQMTARGPLGKDASLDLAQGLDLGHEVIVKTFLSITSAEAKKVWGLKG